MRASQLDVYLWGLEEGPSGRGYLFSIFWVVSEIPQAWYSTSQEIQIGHSGTRFPQDVYVMAKLIGGAPAMTSTYAGLIKTIGLNLDAKGLDGRTLLQTFLAERNLQAVAALTRAGAKDRNGSQHFESWQMFNEP